MATLRRYCGSTLLEIKDGQIREFCGRTLYEIVGDVSQMELMALIAVVSI